MTENALKALTVDVIEQLQKAAGILGSESTTLDQKTNALDDILNYVDDIDTAMDFCKIGGLHVLLPSLESPYAEIRNKSASLIAELAQNNPYCQQQIIEIDVLPKLMNLLCEQETLATSLRAISCVVRSYEPGLREFTKLGGLECLLGCLQKSNDEKLITRTAFFLNSLCSDFPEICDDLVKSKAIEMIMPLVRPTAEYNAALEILLSLLCTLIEKADTNNVSTYVSFREPLQEIIKLASDKAECKEIVEYSEKLLELIIQPSDVADR